jgi:hypothetical protein
VRTVATEREVQVFRRLQKHLGCATSIFANPIGKMPDVGEHGVEAVHDAGYSWAVKTVEAVNRRDTDRCLLQRLPDNVVVHPLMHIVRLISPLGTFSRLCKQSAAPIAQLT